MRLLGISSLDTTGTWCRGELEVECSPSELDRLCRLADVFHPELNVVQVDGNGRSAEEEPSVAVRVWFPPASHGRLDKLLEQRMHEVIPGIDFGLVCAAG